MKYTIRPESPAAAVAIRTLVASAFRDAPHSSGTEAGIVDALRRHGALSLSLVAECQGQTLGHIAFSPVLIDGMDVGWFGLAPFAVAPDYQGQGIGSRLVMCGLEILRSRGAAGCVVLGDPHYYRRFGFTALPHLCYAGAPPEYFMALPFAAAAVSDSVSYHPAFADI